MHISHSQWILISNLEAQPLQLGELELEVWSNTTKCVKNIPCPMEEDKPLLLALVSGDIRDDEEFTDVTLA